MIIETVLELEETYLVNGSINVPFDERNKEYRMVQDWIAEGNVPTKVTDEPIEITIVTMRQARLALLQVGKLDDVTYAINNSTDSNLKIEWEYASEVERDWPSLIGVATALNMTDEDLDNLFALADTL